MQVGDKVFDTLKIINNGQPLNLTKLVDNVATVEYFDFNRDGLHVVLEIDSSRLKKL